MGYTIVRQHSNDTKEQTICFDVNAMGQVFTKYNAWYALKGQKYPKRL